MLFLSVISVTQAEVSKKTAPPAKDKPEATTPPVPAVSTVSLEEISGFESYSKQVQGMVQSALALTRLELGYRYGSHDPSLGGMDCSGSVHHVLRFVGFQDVPRQSDEMCGWVDKKTQLHLTPKATSFDDAEFAALTPGDLIFWTNTTETKRKLPVTHVMIYLGKLKKNGQRIIFGASDGRSYAGQRRSGVSVFDFHLPKPDSSSRLYGYGAAPGLQPASVTPIAAKPTVAQEEVRKPTAVMPLPEAEPKAESKPKEVKPVTESKPKATAAPKRTTTTPKKSPTPSTAKKKAPPTPTKSSVEKSVDRAVDSVRRIFR